MSYQDVRHWYEDYDPDESPADPPVKLVCEVCGRVLCDPPGAVRTEFDDGCSADCMAKREAWEEQRRADYDAAMEAEWKAEAERLSRECPFCGRPSEGGAICPDCSLWAAESVRAPTADGLDCSPEDRDGIPF